MTPQEIKRFSQTFDALKPRRKLYPHPIDKTDSIIALIKESIRLGGNRTMDILKYIRDRQEISKSTLLKILDDNMDQLWYMTKGARTTKYYHLIDDNEE